MPGGLPRLPALLAPGDAGDRVLIHHPVLLFGVPAVAPTAPTVGYHPLAHPSKRGQGEVRTNFPPPCLPLSSVGGWDEGYDAPLP